MPDITDLTSLDQIARESLAAIDAELDTLGARMRELQQARKRINRYLAPPGRKPGPKPVEGKTMPGSHIGPITLDNFTDYLQAHANGGELSAPQIFERDDFEIRGIGTRQRVGLALDKLHDRGVVRLIRVDGMTKIYELTT